MLYCSDCGLANRDGSRFCNECGQRLGEWVTCAKCGFANLSTARFCNQCGWAVEGVPPSAVTRPPDAPEHRQPGTPGHPVGRPRQDADELPPLEVDAPRVADLIGKPMQWGMDKPLDAPSQNQMTAAPEVQTPVPPTAFAAAAPRRDFAPLEVTNRESPPAQLGPVGSVETLATAPMPLSDRMIDVAPQLESPAPTGVLDQVAIATPPLTDESRWEEPTLVPDVPAAIDDPPPPRPVTDAVRSPAWAMPEVEHPLPPGNEAANGQITTVPATGRETAAIEALPNWLADSGAEAMRRGVAGGTAPARQPQASDGGERYDRWQTDRPEPGIDLARSGRTALASALVLDPIVAMVDTADGALFAKIAAGYQRLPAVKANTSSEKVVEQLRAAQAAPSRSRLGFVNRLRGRIGKPDRSESEPKKVEARLAGSQQRFWRGVILAMLLLVVVAGVLAAVSGRL